MNARKYLIEVYLDWFNNYVSVETFAEHNGLTKDQALEIIKLGRDVFNSEHPDY